jgi:hypothetical protein
LENSWNENLSISLGVDLDRDPGHLGAALVPDQKREVKIDSRTLFTLRMEAVQEERRGKNLIKVPISEVKYQIPSVY